LQENKASLLSQLKERMADYTFSFSFRPLGFFERGRCNRSKYSFKKVFAGVCAKYSITAEQALSVTDISEKTKNRILKGAYYPTKNLLFTLALACGFSMQDTEALMGVCGVCLCFRLTRVMRGQESASGLAKEPLQTPPLWREMALAAGTAVLSRLALYVLAYGFAYGRNGDALKGKKLLVSVTTGGSEDEYTPAGAEHFYLSDFLVQFEQTAMFCGMTWLEPVASYSMMYLPGVTPESEKARIDAQIRRHAADIVARVKSAA